MNSKKYKKSLFIFRRDLRLTDNTALILALRKSEKVVPVFIFDPRQIGIKNNYRSKNCIQFMAESLSDLTDQLRGKKAKLYCFKGQSEKVISRMTKQEKIDAIFINKDYTPFSLKRDRNIEKICFKNNIDYTACTDTLLNDPEIIKTKNGTPFAVFNPFYKKSRKQQVIRPKRCSKSNFYTGRIKGACHSLISEISRHKNKNIWVQGGTNRAKKILKKIKDLRQYNDTRNFPAIMTSNLSAHNKFGTVSIREVYHKIVDLYGKNSTLITQLYWRDFFYHIAYHSPFVFGHAYHKKYDALKWGKSKKKFERWCTGTTGFPIVDAGMRQLNKTGYMHNRVRMIVASFLTKDLHISWLWGEKYFAQQLVDYDPCVNNGNWQWVASTGCAAPPYFRIFNPWLQQKKFDPNCMYIKQWIFELQAITPKAIHDWKSKTSPNIKDYPRPMVNHKKEIAKTKLFFKKA